MRIKVAFADDHAIVLNGLQKILSGIDDIVVTDTYSNGDDLLLGLTNRQPDVLFLDIQMPGKNGIELAGIVARQYPSIKIIALTNVDVTIQIRKMLQQGCSGYLFKDSSPETLTEAIRTVYSGRQFLPEAVSKQLLSSMFSHNQKRLTRREKEILKLIAEEFTNQQIAAKLFLSTRTVENHRNNLLQKLDVKNTAAWLG